MTSTNPAKSNGQSLKPREDPISDGFEKTLINSLKIGAATGALGLFWGTANGITLGSPTLGAFALARGIEWSWRGSAFYGTRQAILSRHGPVDQATPEQKLEASTIGAAVTQAAFMGFFRGPRMIFPGALLGSVVGAAGQHNVNLWISALESPAENTSGGWLEGKWSPMTRLTNQEYEHILEEKLLRLDAEIALIDDSIAALKEQKNAEGKVAAKAPLETQTDGRQS